MSDKRINVNNSYQNLSQLNSAQSMGKLKPRILVAEDMPTNYKLIQAFLGPRYDLDWAKDGQEAVSMFAVNKYDAVLMDMKMPVMDGIEATRRIRAISENIPIIAQTAFALNNDKEHCVKAGCTDYISKPISWKYLMSLLDKYIVSP